MTEVQELKGIKGLRVFAPEAKLEEAAAALLKKARELGQVPSLMEFRMMTEEEPGSEMEYHIALWCG